MSASTSVCSRISEKISSRGGGPGGGGKGGHQVSALRSRRHSPLAEWGPLLSDRHRLLQYLTCRQLRPPRQLCLSQHRAANAGHTTATLPRCTGTGWNQQTRVTDVLLLTQQELHRCLVLCKARTGQPEFVLTAAPFHPQNLQ